MLIIGKIKKSDIVLEQTCGACPEQYDALYNGNVIGYLRLRHGYFRVDCGDITVYSAQPDGDGCFTSEEREKYLDRAKKAIKDKYNEEH